MSAVVSFGLSASRSSRVCSIFAFCKTSGSILELEQFPDAKELPAFEDRLVLVVNNDVTVRRIRLADKDQADAKLTLHVSSKFFLVDKRVMVLLFIINFPIFI